jgi:hypothetical protein
MISLLEIRVDEAVVRISKRTERPVVGCGEQELQQFQANHGIKLPAAYLEYLGRVGKDPGSFLVGSDLRFGALDTLQTSAQALLNDDKGPSLPPEAFVFCCHQGYQFLFFLLDGHPDPEVQYYLEGERAFRLVASSFSSWLLEAAIDEFPD